MENKNDLLNKVVKVVYFDENSALDYLDIRYKGRYKIEEANENKKSKRRKRRGEAKFGLGAKLSKLISIISFNGEVNAEYSAERERSNDNLIKSSVSNTILTGFLEELSEYIIEFDGYKLKMLENSFAYMKSFTPFLKLLEQDSLNVDNSAGIKLNSLDDILTESKGYYEFVAKKKGKKDIVLRFNNSALKNNYRFNDFNNMNITSYGIKVGTIDRNSIDMDGFFESFKNDSTIDSEEIIDIYKRFDRDENQTGKEETEGNQSETEPNHDLLDLYDVVLAGVKYVKS
ncbi:hypothetical protein IRB23SM22_07020 [Alkalibacterium sp. s-m-22]